MRWMVLFLGIGCTDVGEDTGGGSDDACELADTIDGCDECDNGPVTCTFGAVSETHVSCGDCQARNALYDALCAAGETASADEIEAGTVCEPAGS